MDKTCLKYRLTKEEREQFEDKGYMIVEDALSSDQVSELTQAIDQLHHEKLEGGHDPKKALFYPDFIPKNDLFKNLVDYEKVFPKVMDILGWNIYLYHAHAIVTPPSGLEKSDKTFGWHQDSGRINFDIESSHPRPRISLKVAYFLSDMSEPDRGNFWIIPRSHFSNEIDRPKDEVGQPEGAMPVQVKAGTAVFFDRRLWHAASPNWSDITRKVLFYGYGYRWIRTKDDMSVQHLWKESTPIQRQLLGDGVNANGFYTPTDEDVPLRMWLKEHDPEKAKWRL